MQTKRRRHRFGLCPMSEQLRETGMRPQAGPQQNSIACTKLKSLHAICYFSST